MYSRRLFMGGAAAAMGLAACGSPAVSKVGTRQLKTLGLQTYTLREIFEPDPAGTLAMLKELGYDYVELNERNFTDRTAEELISLVKDAGLYAPATHYNMEKIRSDFGQTTRDAQALGVNYVIMPWTDEPQRTVEGYKRNAAMFNERGRQARDAGFKLAYHNHQFEFDDLGGGVTGMDIMLEETDPDLFDFELDLFWARLGDVDIPALFRAHPGRFKLCHIKDMNGSPAQYRDSRDYGAIGAALMVNVGEGNIPFEDYFALNDVSGMEYFVIEHDSPPKPFRASMKQSIDDVRAMRF